MRIIPDDAPLRVRGLFSMAQPVCVDLEDTIPISDAEWDAIGVGYEYDCWDDHEGYKIGFSQYLRELVQLREAMK